MINEIIKYDTNFDESIFLTRIDHVFIMILDAIMERDMSSVSHYLSDDVLNKFTSLVNEYLNDGKIRLFDEMNIKESNIESVNVSEDKINITCRIVTRYMDYFINEDGDYISGINDHRVENTHYVVFSKRLDASELKAARRCPNCGHTLDINASGICPYCNGVFNMEKYDYIVTSMDLI